MPRQIHTIIGIGIVRVVLANQRPSTIVRSIEHSRTVGVRDNDSIDNTGLSDNDNGLGDVLIS